MKAEIAKAESETPRIGKDRILFALERFKNLDVSIEENRERLVNALLATVVLYDVRLIITTTYDDEPITVFTKEELSETIAAANAASTSISDVKHLTSPGKRTCFGKSFFNEDASLMKTLR